MKDNGSCVLIATISDFRRPPMYCHLISSIGGYLFSSISCGFAHQHRTQIPTNGITDSILCVCWEEYLYKLANVLSFDIFYWRLFIFIYFLRIHHERDEKEMKLK
jgi:hypothetical protein